MSTKDGMGVAFDGHAPEPAIRLPVEAKMHAFGWWGVFSPGQCVPFAAHMTEAAARTIAAALNATQREAVPIEPEGYLVEPAEKSAGGLKPPKLETTQPHPASDVSVYIEVIQMHARRAREVELELRTVLARETESQRRHDERMAEKDAVHDALVYSVMRGSHREARDLARARFVELTPDEREHASKVQSDAQRAESAEATVARLTGALRSVVAAYESFNWIDRLPCAIADARKALAPKGVPE